MSRVVWIVLVLMTAGCSTPAADTETEGPQDGSVPSTNAPTALAPRLLSEPLLLSPTDGARGLSASSLTLSWSAASANVPRTITYEAFVDGRSRCVTTSLTCTITGLVDGVTYRWYVAALLEGATQVSSAAWTFRTNTPPAIPRIDSPLSGSHSTTETATILLAGLVDADGDDLDVRAELRNVDTGQARTVSCTGDRCVASALSLASSYTLVVSVSDGKATVRTPALSFRTDAPPLPVRIDPGDDGAVQVPLVAGWEAPTTTDPDGDAITYTYKVEDAAGRLVDECAGLVEPRCVLEFPKHGQTYRIRIEAKDTYGLTASSAFSITTTLPIVLVRGYAFTGDAIGDDTWAPLVPILQDAGFHVIDFHAGPKTTMDLDDRDEGGIASIAYDAAEAIERALVANGYSRDQPIDVIAHSMGGLVSRYLVEMGGVTYEAGPYEITVSTKWDGQIQTLTTLATPHRGASLAGWCFYAVCDDMTPGSTFLQTLGYSPRPSQTVYFTAIGDEDAVVSEQSGRLDSVSDHLLIQGACHSDSPCSIIYHPETLALLDLVLGLQYSS